MRVRNLAASGCLLAALSFGAIACGDSGSDSSDGGSGDTGSTTLTIYSSLPLQGDARRRSASIVNAEKLALQEAGGRVGAFTIKYVSLDDATASGRAEPGATSASAREAAQDRTTIAYLGEFDPGASAISVPILNEAGILQVSPADTDLGLTRPATAKGTPEKYYPSGKRTFGRVVPADHVQGAAQVAYQLDNGCTKTYVLNDGGLFGSGVSGQVVEAAKTRGLEIAGNDVIDPEAANFRSVASQVAGSGADCVFYGGIAHDSGVQLWHDLHSAMPTAKLFGAHALAEPAFSAKIGPSAERLTYLTLAPLDPKLYPPAAQDFFTAYREAFGAEADPYAIYGYEAMKVTLQAIQNAGEKGNNREAVIRSFFQIKRRDSVLGTYSIDENGDTTLGDYGAARVEDGKLVFDRMIKTKASGS